MSTTIRHAHPSDYGRVILHVNAWWGGRDMAPMLPKLFFLHFEGTSFVAENDDGTLAAFLIGFLSQTDSEEAYIHFVGVAPDHHEPRRPHACPDAKHQRGFEELGAEDRQRLLAAQVGDGADEVNAADALLAVVPEIVEDHKWPIGPAAEHGIHKTQRPYHRVEVISPRFRVGVAVEGLL